MTPRLRCRLIFGPANNQLTTDDVADLLDSRNIVWMPDILASAGGIVHAINIEQHGMAEEQVAPHITAIGDTVAWVLAEARKSSLTPLAVAHHKSSDRIRSPPDFTAPSDTIRLSQPQEAHGVQVEFNDRRCAPEEIDKVLGAGVGICRRLPPEGLGSWEEGAGYAAHMRTPDFLDAIREVLDGAQDRATTVFCSESVCWRCHRRLVADFRRC